jgi:hypothetical protein
MLRDGSRAGQFLATIYFTKQYSSRKQCEADKRAAMASGQLCIDRAPKDGQQMRLTAIPTVVRPDFEEDSF